MRYCLAVLLLLTGCGPDAYVADKIADCINHSDHSPQAVEACGRAYGYGNK